MGQHPTLDKYLKCNGCGFSGIKGTIKVTIKQDKLKETAKNGK
jgi:hypothetical protein